MKKILFLVLPLLLCLTANAQTTIKIVNNENCSITVTQLCYNPTTCAILSTGSSVSVPAGATASLTLKACSTSAASLAFKVCWTVSACTPSCTIVNGGISTSTLCYPNPAKLSSCSGCVSSGSTAIIKFDPTNNVLEAN